MHAILMKTLPQRSNVISAALVSLVIGGAVWMCAANSNNLSAAEGTAKTVRKEKTPASEKIKPEAGQKARTDSGEKAILRDGRRICQGLRRGRCQGDRQPVGRRRGIHRRSGPDVAGPRGDRQGVCRALQAAARRDVGTDHRFRGFPAPDVAIEKGIARVKSPTQRSESVSRYDVLHVQVPRMGAGDERRPGRSLCSHHKRRLPEGTCLVDRRMAAGRK